MDFFSFVTSSSFLVDVSENWQSEFLQFFLFIGATVWFVQRGSPESKNPGDEGLGSDEEQIVGHARADSPLWARRGGWRTALYSNSLLLVMGAIFVWTDHVASPDFWDRTLQNWQSEFLAVGAMITFAIYLRQRGSAESKPVGMPHHVTESRSASGV